MKNKIEKVKLEDLEDLLNLLYQLSPPKKEKINKRQLLNILRKIIKDKNYYIAVYKESNEKIVGTGTLLKQLNLSHSGRPYCHIENIVIDRNFRGRGIGKSIIDELVKKAKKENCYKVILNCQKHNILFYKKCCFEETGEMEMRKDF